MRSVCKTCLGSGVIKNRQEKCPFCEGTGYIFGMSLNMSGNSLSGLEAKICDLNDRLSRLEEKFDHFFKEFATKEKCK